jgi:GT2 family glycosyltransferase
VTTPKTVVDYHKSVAGQSFLKLARLDDVTLHVNDQNLLGLSEVYNNMMDDYPNHILVFVHDDVHVWDTFMAEKLLTAHETHSVVGLAGTSKLRTIEPNTRSAWHLMTAPVSDSMSGVVYHQGDGKRWPTVFGETPKNCKLMDGLFLSVCNDDRMRDVRWDEDFKFHHYDLAFCARCLKAGIKMTTMDIICLHESRGDSMFDEEWKNNDYKFNQKYREILNTYGS